ncbi:hypothetical protein COL26b_011933 [Colletotrichum chrysophilum]|uniref:uncharacterized protein n=1 Tax=Colletotrichum chrysophilum TaxID=1836956 RepID=UPI002301D0EC|nr:uncharacterized protein COL26b_011933 [Colletotrichum chrysophilum]KAJ0365801.1 hypothetical protein COL26b_011933 [Colletotrichum chrysophilum]
MSDTKSNAMALGHKSVSEDEEGGRAGVEALQGTPVPIDEDDIVARMNNLDPPVTPDEVKAVRRKIDMRLPPFLLVLYMFTWLDRGALGNAALMGIREDLGFSPKQFSLAEWGRRISIYLSATPLAGAFGGWVAYGVANISNPIVKHWQALFLIEGLLTILIGLLCVWVLPDRPHNTKWLTPRERDVATWRMMQDGNRTHGKINWKTTLNQLRDWRLWMNIFIYMGQVLQTYTIATFTPIIVATFGYDNVKAQLMVAPPYCVAHLFYRRGYWRSLTGRPTAHGSERKIRCHVLDIDWNPIGGHIECW